MYFCKSIVCLFFLCWLFLFSYLGLRLFCRWATSMLFQDYISYICSLRETFDIFNSLLFKLGVTLAFIRPHFIRTFVLLNVWVLMTPDGFRKAHSVQISIWFPHFCEKLFSNSTSEKLNDALTTVFIIGPHFLASTKARMKLFNISFDNVNYFSHALKWNQGSLFAETNAIKNVIIWQPLKPDRAKFISILYTLRSFSSRPRTTASRKILWRHRTKVQYRLFCMKFTYVILQLI